MAEEAAGGTIGDGPVLRIEELPTLRRAVDCDFREPSIGGIARLPGPWCEAGGCWCVAEEEGCGAILDDEDCVWSGDCAV